MDFFDDLGWDDAGALLLGGPIGYAGYRGYKGQKKGDKAAMQGLQQAQGEMQKLKQSQYTQRMGDLEKALAYFGDVDELMLDMYGGRKKKEMREIKAAPTARRGLGHFGASPPPAPPAVAETQAYFAPPPAPSPGTRYPNDPLRGKIGDGRYRGGR